MGASATMAAAAAGCEAGDGADVFEELPDHLLLHILGLVGDARCLARCRAACRRLNALVPHADRLLIRVDAVVPAPSRPSGSLLPLLGHLLRSALRSLSSGLVSTPAPPPWRSPVDLIRGFPGVRRLEIELPGGDLRLEKGAVVRWTAEFGGRLRRCAILAARRITCGEDEAAEEIGGGIKERVMWTIGVLISASARHYVAREVARERCSCGSGEEEMEGVVVSDRDGEGTLVMDREGVRECVHGGGSEQGRMGSRRTAVPAVRIRMRWAREVEVGGGARMEGAALVVVRAAEGGGGVEGEEEAAAAAERWAAGAFEGGFRFAAAELLKGPGYSLEMNSF